MIKKISIGLLVGLLGVLTSHAQTIDVYAEYTRDWETVGPPRGTLMIVGGAASKVNYDYFMELVGDPNELILFVPTAGSQHDETNIAYVRLLEAGAKNVTILHAKNREEADTEAFAAPLRRAKAVFIGGGFQNRLAAAYLNTLTHRLMFEILERGGVIAGSSAGASIQGSFLYGGGDKQKVGLGFVKNSAIGQHYVRRNRMGSVARILKTEPDLFGFGVDEATAAIVRGNELEVIGEGKVAIYDPSRSDYSKQLQEYLFAGDKYDMAARRVTYRTEPIPQDLWTAGGKRQWKSPANTWTTVGPPQGKLLLYGSIQADPGALAHFLKSLDGSKEPIVVLSTGNDSMRVENQKVVAELQKLGAGQVSFLHTINSDKANSEAFACILGRAKAVWICDSRSWQLADAYLHTLIHKELFGVLSRNGAVGGNGDGAAIMASRLFGEPEKYKWHTGYGLVQNSMIVKASQSHKEMSKVKEILAENAKLQAVVLAEDSKLIIEKNQLKVDEGNSIRIYKGDQKQEIVVSSGTPYQW